MSDKVKVKITGLPDKMMFEDGGKKQPPKKPVNKNYEYLKKNNFFEKKVEKNNTTPKPTNVTKPSNNKVVRKPNSDSETIKYYDSKGRLYKEVYPNKTIREYNEDGTEKRTIFNNNNSVKIYYSDKNGDLYKTEIPNEEVVEYNKDDSYKVTYKNNKVENYDAEGNLIENTPTNTKPSVNETYEYLKNVEKPTNKTYEYLKKNNLFKENKDVLKPNNNKVVRKTENPVEQLNEEGSGKIVYPNGTVETYKNNVLVDKKETSNPTPSQKKPGESTKKTPTVTTKKEAQSNISTSTSNPYEQIKPYEGDKYGDRRKGTPESNASIHSKEEWQKIAEKVGFKGGDNAAFQKYLLENKENPLIINAIQELHKKYGNPKTGEKWDDGFLGYRWDAVFDALNAPETPTTEKQETPTEQLPAATPEGNTYDPADNSFQLPPYERRKLPFYQVAPDLANFASANQLYNYWTPDYTHQEIQPPTLNIQDQLNSMDSSLASTLRTTTGNPILDQARKNAVFSQVLDAKDQAYARKQNYDAEGRFRADEFNIKARNEEMENDINAASKIHNEYVSEAKDNMTYEKMASIQNMYKKYMMNEATENRYETLSKMFPNMKWNSKTGVGETVTNVDDFNFINRNQTPPSKVNLPNPVKPNTFGGVNKVNTLPVLDEEISMYNNIDNNLSLEEELNTKYGR